jgi:hypothetical protein
VGRWKAAAPDAAIARWSALRWLMPPSAIETYPYRTFARAPSSRHQKFQNELKI